MAEQPDWQPIRRLPLIESMMDGMLQTLSSYYEEGKDGVHKRGKISGKRASDPTIREQVFGSKSS
jgi:hypothetical protein